MCASSLLCLLQTTLVFGCVVFVFNDTATTEIYTLSLHDALPIFEYAVLAGDPAFGNHIGIWLVELGVGMTVSSVMVTIFVSFADFDASTGRSR